MVIGNTPQAALLGQAIQAQVKEGGFDLELIADRVRRVARPDRRRATTRCSKSDGRVGSTRMATSPTSSRTAGSQNISGYGNPSVDALIDQARAEPDVAARRDLYGQVITQLNQDLPIIYLYRQKNFTGVARTVVGVQVYGDGLLRFGTAGFAAA